jgi:hypothetical protein
MQPDPEVLNRVALWRQMEKDGTMSDDELIKAVIWLREKRRAAATSAGQAAADRPKKSKAPTKSADDLLGELGL